MKKIVIVGTGSAGLISAAFIHKFWDDEVDITVIYDGKNKNIAVGESTTPLILSTLDILGIEKEELIKEIGTTLKLGINFKNWIPDTEYFHGFGEGADNSNDKFLSDIRTDETSAVHAILNDVFDGGANYNVATTELPSNNLDAFSYALHIDTQAFLELLFDRFKDDIKFVDDIVEEVNVDGKNITSIECKNSGIIDADFFIDASGFNCVLFKHLDPEWVDVSNILPLDRAIPQQIPNTSGEVPSYTLAEATDNGWIWQLPIGERYGTGYLYSSKFTSDEEAREKYNTWLLENHNVELTTDRIIKYRPGYYKDNWIGNCMTVGLSSGFIEPLEATGIMIISKQIYNFLVFNSALNNLNHTRKYVNRLNRNLYDEIVRFNAMHYCTDRTDSDFWKYMTNNKHEWVEDLQEKCKYEFLDNSIFNNLQNSVWSYDSYIQVLYGLGMFNKDAIIDYLRQKPNGQQILDYSERIYELEKTRNMDNRDHSWVSHKGVIEVVIDYAKQQMNRAAIIDKYSHENYRIF